MLLQTFVTLSLGGLLLLFLAFFFQKKALLLGIMGGLLLLVTGIIIFNDPLATIVGSTTTTAGLIATSDIVTQNINDSLNTLIAWLSLLAGFSAFTGFSIAVYNTRKGEYSEDFNLTPGSATGKEW